jgi:DNA polymerase-3 subunit beta
MEVTIDRNELLKAVSRVQSIIEKRSNMPILSTILLTAEDGHIYLSATDLEISIQQKLSAKVVDSGSITLPGRKLFEMAKESKGSVIHIKEKENNRIFVTDEKARYNLPSLSADEFPLFVEPEDVVSVEVDTHVLREMINKTIFSVTMDEAGFKLSGVYTEKVALKGKTYLRMVSTDGHRLSMIDKEIKNIEGIEIESGIMVPKKGMAELLKLTSEGETIILGFKKNNCVAKKENCVIVIRLLESRFPDYNAVIPQKSTCKVQIERDSIFECMKRMMILTDENYRGVKITLDHNTMELASNHPDLGDAQDNLEVQYEGERLEMGFNAKYFIDVLQAMESEVVELAFIDDSSPCVLTGSADKGFLGLIMPMRI